MSRLNHSNLKDRQRFYKEKRDSVQDCFSYKMPFGLYRGKPLAAIPIQYLNSICPIIKSNFILEKIADEILRRSRTVK